MATQDMVDYHTEILSSVLTKPIDEDDDDSDPLVVMEFFKLHGSMTQKERIEIFKTFRQANSGVLLCTVSNALHKITKSRYFQSNIFNVTKNDTMTLRKLYEIVP